MKSLLSQVVLHCDYEIDAMAKTMYFADMKATPSSGTTSGPFPEIPTFLLYGESTRTAHRRMIHVETIASRSRLHQWHIRPHRHRDMHQILLVQSGGFAAAIDTCGGDLIAPAVLIMPAGSVHSFQFAQDTRGIVLTFGSDLACKLAAWAPAILDVLQRPSLYELERASINATEIDQLGQMLLTEFSLSGSDQNVALPGLLAALLAKLRRLAQGAVGEGEEIGSVEREIVTRYRQILEDTYRQHLDISWYARKLGVSEARLRSACRAVAGQSPVEVFQQRLVAEAERQLRYTLMTVSQIAHFLGFDDAAYFSRFVSQRLGVSPKAFRLSAANVPIPRS